MMAIAKQTTWKTAKLDEVASIDRSGVSPENIESGTTYVGLENIASGGTFVNVDQVSNGELASTKFTFSPLHLLYGKLRPYLAKIACPDFSGVCSTDILPILPGPKLDKRFLCYFLRQPHMVDFATSRCTGANLPRLSPAKLAEFEIPLPPLTEQKRIADILDKADAVRQKRQEVRSIVKKELLKSAFRDELGDPQTNPKDWPIEKLGDVINFVGGSQPPKDTFISEPSPDYVRLVQIRDFKSNKYPTYIPKELAKRPFKKNDVMIARYGPPVFQILRGLEGSYNVALMKAENTARTTKDFIFHLLQIPEIHDVVVANSERTAGQSGTNLPLLKNLEIPIPPVEKQEEIAKKLRSIESYLLTATKHGRSADNLFNSLVQRAFKGEL